MSWSVGRVSTLQFSLTNRLGVSQTKLDLQRAGLEVSSGRRADIFADLGPKAAAVLKLRTREDNTQAYLASNQVLGSKLDAMLSSVDFVRGQVQQVLETALSNATRPVNGAAQMQLQARSALESLVATLNTSYNGEHLFSGTDSNVSPLMRWSQTNASTGLSPQDVLQGIVGAGPSSAANAQTMIDDIDSVFNSTYSADPNRNFESTFYNGTPILDGSGQPSARITSRLSVGQELNYGVQANDPGFRDILKGLAMLASTDVSQIQDTEAYQAWMTKTIDVLSTGQEAILGVSARIGFNQQIVESAKTRLTDISLVQRSQIGNYENVDPYEAVTRMTNLETQLQASYQVSARLGALSFMNYM